MKKLTNLFLAAVMVVGVTSIAGCIQGESNNKYDITVKATVGGVITTDKTQAEKGETVNITATPADGYYLESLSYNGNNSYYAFAMPSEDVEVTATFAAVTASVKQYDIIVDTSIGGEFTVNTAVAPSYLKAPAGTTVSLTYAPADGYVLDYIELNGEKLEKGADSFIMPAKIANVYACFASEVNEYTVETQNVEKGGVVTVNRQTCGQGGVVIADYIPMTAMFWTISPSTAKRRKR